MTKFHYDSQAIAPDELQKWSRHFVDKYLNKIQNSPPLLVDLSFDSTRAAYEKRHKNSFTEPIHSVRRDNRFTIHFCGESLKNIPLLALQGWLDLELTCCLVELQSELYRFSFSKQFLPSFPVSGSAVNLVRHLVEHLKLGLMRHVMTKMIIDLGHGLPQVHFYFFKIMPCQEDKKDYQRIIPHRWVRALFLSQKLKEFMAISLLDNRNIGFARELKSLWCSHHGYLPVEDRSLLKELASIPNQHLKEPFSSKLLEMFKKVQSHLFGGPNERTVSYGLH